MGFLDKINRVWSGLDFWDKAENQRQQQQFAAQDEEEKRRRLQQQAAARAAVNNSTTTAQPDDQGSVFDFTKKLVKIGSQSDFLKPEKIGNTLNTAAQLVTNPTGMLLKKAADVAGNAELPVSATGMPGDKSKLKFTDLVKQIPKAVRDVSVGVARGVARVPETVLRTVAQPGAELFDPNADTSSGEVKDPIRRFLYGKEPVQTYYKQGEEAGKAVAQLTKNPKLEKYGILAAPVIGALDLWPGGKPEKELIEQLAKEGTEAGVRGILEKEGLQAARDSAEQLAKETDPAKITSILKSDVSKAPETVPKVTPEDAPKLPGTKRDVEAVAKDAIEVEPGIKSTNLVKVVNEADNAARQVDAVMPPVARNVPDVTNPIALAKANDVPVVPRTVTPEVPMADFSKAVEAPLRKAPEELPVRPEPPVQVDNVRPVTPEGNPGVIPDAAAARQAADEGIVPIPAESPVALEEAARANAAEQVAREQVSTPLTAEELQAIQKARTASEPGNIIPADQAAMRIGLGDRYSPEQFDQFLNPDRVEVPRVNAEAAPAINALDRPVEGGAPEAINTTYEKIFNDPGVSKDAKLSITNMTHEVHSDKALIDSAHELVNSDPKLAEDLFNTRFFASQGKVDSHVHLGNELVDQFNRMGDTDAAGRIYDELIHSATQTGQGLRAFQSISKISPQGIVRFAENMADKSGKPVTDELRAELIATAKEVAQMPDGEAKAAAIQKMLQTARQPDLWSGFGDFVSSVLSIPRGLMASADLSFGGRQGAVLGSRFPQEWAEANIKSAKYAIDSQAYEEGMRNLANLTDQNGEALYGTFKKMGLDMPGVTGQSEEVFGKANILESKALKKAGIGHIVAGSDRAFTGAAAELRANVAKKIIDDYGGVAGIKDWTGKDLSDLGRVINTATGRGHGKEGGWFEKAAPTLGKTLFSARLWKSRLDILNPLYYARLSGPARKVAIQSSGAFSALVGVTLAAAAASGASVEMDPRSSDFGKIKVGNTRYDIMGGLQQNIVLAARELTGQKKNSVTGEIQSLTTGKYGQPTRLSVLTDVFENKLSPVLGFGARMLEGTDISGKPINPWTEVAKMFIPLGVQQIYSSVKDEIASNNGEITPGAVATGVAKSAPDFVGVGAQTYGPSTPKEKTANDVLKQLNKDGIQLSENAILDYADSGDFDKAKRAAEYNVMKLQSDSKATPAKISRAKDLVQKVNLQSEGVPLTKDGVQARAEEGDFEKAIRGASYQFKKMSEDPNVPKSKLKDAEDDITRLQVTRDGKFPPPLMEMYSKTSLSEWRAMGNPKSEDYDPELYDLLWKYDEALASKGVSRSTKDGEKQKYSAKGSGSGSGGGYKKSGAAKGFTTSIGMQSFKEGGGFQPLKPLKADFAEPVSAIPLIQPVPNYDRSKLKKITVKEGARL